MNTEEKKFHSYVAITHKTHPLTGDCIPVVRTIELSTTIGYILDWYKCVHKEFGAETIDDLRIVKT